VDREGQPRCYFEPFNVDLMPAGQVPDVGRGPCDLSSDASLIGGHIASVDRADPPLKILEVAQPLSKAVKVPLLLDNQVELKEHDLQALTGRKPPRTRPEAC
jgi:hypothetical protein